MTAPLCFYAHRNGVPQPLYTSQYNRVLCTTTDFNDGSIFDVAQSRVIAPYDGRLWLGGQCFIEGGLAVSNNSNETIKFIKNSSPWNFPPAVPNGWDTFSPIGGPLYPFTSGIGNAAGGGVYIVLAGDAIEMALYNVGNGGNTAVLQGHRAHTWFCGMFWSV